MSKKNEKALLKICTDLAEGQRNIATELANTRRDLTSRIQALEAQLRARVAPAPVAPRNEERERAKYLVGRLARRRGITRSEAWHTVYDVFAAAQGYDPLEEATKVSRETSGIEIIARRGHLPELIETVQGCGRN